MKHLHIIKRSVAKNLGFRHYVSDTLCSREHFSERLVNGGCIECLRARRAENKESLKEWALDWRIRNREKTNQRTRDKRLANGDAMRARERELAAQAKDKIRERAKVYYEANKERILSRCKEYYQANKPTTFARCARRRARKSGAEGQYSASDVSSLVIKQKRKCASCTEKLVMDGEMKYHVDHIMPLAKGGSNWPSNIHLLCQTCNLRKGAKHPIQFAQENGRLL